MSLVPPDGITVTGAVDRAAFVELLYVMAGSPGVSPSIAENTYSDVTAAHPQAAAIAWATDLGLVRGWADGSFRPDASIDPVAVRTIMWRAAGSPPEVSLDAGDHTASVLAPQSTSLTVVQTVLDGIGDGQVTAGFSGVEVTDLMYTAVERGVLTDNTVHREFSLYTSEGSPSGGTSAVPGGSSESAVGTPWTTSPQEGMSGSGADLVSTALDGLGGQYVWGGTEYKRWDCSGFTQWVYAQNGQQIPRVTWDQFAAATRTTTPEPGDLVSQNNGSHVGIYLGDDQMISALNPDQGTMIHSVDAMPLDGFYTFR
ncbi:C40 family peptidase [Kocuria sp.]|uniref:C40 family peptidase n=1 Tax=Kocuria sp. TaxID=1871328 RepID=UPI0034CFAC4D